MQKSIFLERLQLERDKFELLVNRVGFTRRLTIRGMMWNLSVKDLLADVLARERFISDRLDEILHNEIHTPCTSYRELDKFRLEHGYPDYESPLLDGSKPDHLVIHKHKNIALDEIVAQELAAYANILSALERLRQADLTGRDLFHRAAEQTYRTYRRYGREITRWMMKFIASNAK